MEDRYYILELLVRVFTGILFLFQGYDKLFKLKISGVVEAFNFEAQKQNVPQGFVKVMAAYTSTIEFFGGILLILGAFKTIILSLIGLDLVLVAVAFSVIQPMWDMKHVYPRLVLVSALLMFPAAWGYFSIDHLIANLLTK